MILAQRGAINLAPLIRAYDLVRGEHPGLMGGASTGKAKGLLAGLAVEHGQSDLKSDISQEGREILKSNLLQSCRGQKDL